MSYVVLPKKLFCKRCGHSWVPRGSGDENDGKFQVRTCPKCKSPYWDKERSTSIKKGGIQNGRIKRQG